MRHNFETIPGVKTQIILDDKGQKSGVYFPIHEYVKLVEKFEDLCLVAMADSIKKKNEPTTTLEKIKRKRRTKKK